VILTQESLEKSKSVQKLEEAAAELYKALQTGRDRGLICFHLHEFFTALNCRQKLRLLWKDWASTKRTMHNFASVYWIISPLCSPRR
jgi:hypothetical protein